MEKYIPLNKRSKKEQKSYNRMQRSTWGTFNPVTRIMPNGRGYDRNRIRKMDMRMDND